MLKKSLALAKKLVGLFPVFQRGSGDSLNASAIVNVGGTVNVNIVYPQSENAALHEQNEQARKDAIVDLQQHSRTADNPDQFEQALTELKAGRAGAAETLFRNILEESRKKGHLALREAARAACHIGAIAFYHDTQKALHAYKEATELDPDNVDAWNWLGHLYRRIGNLEKAEFAYRKVLDLGDSNNSDEYRAIAWGNLGNVFSTRGDLDGAEEMYRKALEIEKKLGRKEGMANAYGNLGNVFFKRGDLDSAEKMHRKSLEIEKKLGRKGGMANDYGNLGNVFFMRDDLDSAEKMHRKALEINEELGRKEGMANDYGNLGNVFFIRDDLDRAEKMHRKALEINKQLGYKEGMANAYANLGIVSRKRGDLAEACRLWGLARDLFAEIGARPRVEQVERLMREAGCKS